MRINELLKNQQINFNEKINPDAVKKEVDSIVLALNNVDKGLYNISNILLQNNSFDVRKDILSFVTAVNDMYKYLVDELMLKVNPPAEEETKEEK